jgi:hypothetical protein
MGLFGLAIGKKATARKADVKIKKIEARQGAKTDRQQLRSSAKVDRATVKAAADSVAYQNGVIPLDPLSSITGLVGNGLSAVASFFGGGNAQLSDSSGLMSSQGSQVSGFSIPSTSDGLTISESGTIKPAYLIGGALLLLMLLKKQR